MHQHVVSHGWRPLLFVAALAHVGAAQQSARVSGTVRDTSGHPIAMVRLSTGGAHALTDSAGRFSLGGLTSGANALVVRRLGFQPLDTTLTLLTGRSDTVAFVLALLPQDLPGITTNMDAILRDRLPDFYRHRTAGGGFFFDRRDIDAKQPQYLSDLLRSLPGTRVMMDRTGRGTLRMNRSSSGPRDCPPDVWLDGVRAEGLNVDDVGIHDVEAVELYRGPAGLPPEFNDRLGRPNCGAVVIWTRLPG
jgi:hypothetical protein